MEIDGITVRVDQPAEPIVFDGHRGACRYCAGGLVKMRRDLETWTLKPDDCRCLQCGQAYYVVIEGSLEAWDREQWAQKWARARQDRGHST
jgi:hypothetical protein